MLVHPQPSKQQAAARCAGPSLNPCMTFGWEAIYRSQSVVEHVFVFWVAQLTAGVMGGFAYIGAKEFVKGGQPKRKSE